LPVGGDQVRQGYLVDQTEQPVPVLRLDALAKLIATPEPTKSFEDVRDATILQIFYSSGVRLAELANLRYLPDDPEANDVDLDQQVLRVLGKAARLRGRSASVEAPFGRPAANRSAGANPPRDKNPCMCAAATIRGNPASTTAPRRRAPPRTRAALKPPAPPPPTTTSSCATERPGRRGAGRAHL